MTSEQLSDLLATAKLARKLAIEAFYATQPEERMLANKDAKSALDDLVAEIDRAWVDALRREVT